MLFSGCIRALRYEGTLKLLMKRAEVLIDEYLVTLQRTIGMISRHQVSAVVEALLLAWRENRQVFICGNGGSAATASHMANDLNKYTIVSGKRRMRAIALTDNMPVITAWANDVSYESVFREQLANLAQPNDVLIAISASGNSPNVLKALEFARENRLVCIGFTGDKGGRLKELVDICVHIPDNHIGRQEDGHMILDHVISSVLRELIQNSRGEGEK